MYLRKRSVGELLLSEYYEGEFSEFHSNQVKAINFIAIFPPVNCCDTVTVMLPLVRMTKIVAPNIGQYLK